MKKIFFLLIALFLFLPQNVFAQVHDRPVTTATLSPEPTSLGSGLSFYSDPVTVTLNATAASGFSIANTYYKVDGGPQLNYTDPFTVSGTGKHQIEYWSIDNTGIEELTHKFNSFTISYQHGVINLMAQNGNNMDIQIHIENIQPYLSYIHAANGGFGTNCWDDGSAAFEIYNAETGARVGQYSGGGGFHCGNIGEPSEGNQWLAFPPMQLPSGTYFIHYSGGIYDWITEDFTYTAPIPPHNNPVTTAELSPEPTSPGDGLTFYANPVTVSLSATADSGYNIANTYYKIDGGSQQTYSSPFTVSGVGKHHVEYWSIDNSGISESHKSKNFTISYQHGVITSIEQNGISIETHIHIDNIQPYLTYIHAANGNFGTNCWDDGSAAFELYNAVTGAKVAQYSGGGSFHCGNIGDPSEGNQWLAFPPLLLPAGTYFLHYSGGPFDWITDPFVYTPTPKTTINLATQNGEGTYSNPTTVTLSATAAVGTTLGNTYYKVDNGAQQTYTGPFTITGGGQHTVDYWSVDNVGVQEAHKTETFTIYQNQAPTVEPVSNVTTNRGQTFTANSSFIDTDSTSWTATVDYGDIGGGEEPLTLNPDKTFSLSHQYNTAGVYTVVVVVRDNQQSTGTTQATITVVIPDPITTTFNSSADSYVKSGAPNRNLGAGVFMRLQPSGDNRSLVRFDQSAMQAAIGNREVQSAKLRLTITDGGTGWGTTGRTIDVHRLIANWSEGNGTENDDGTGSGTTWSCATDSIISNASKNCSGSTEWEMGQPNNPSVHPWVQTPSATQTITNNQSGIVEFDVTSDVAAFLNGSDPNYGWLIKKTNEALAGNVSFGTKESSVVPQLVVTY